MTNEEYSDTAAAAADLAAWEKEQRELKEERRAEEEAWEIEPDQFMSDAEADADALASAGWGTDEDYGYFGDDF